MRHANLNLLATLKVLLETRHLGHAADLLHLSQPSVSKQLARLREDFDDPLLVRDGQQWQLTPRAEALRGELAATLDAVERLYAPQRFDPAACQRTFRLASSDYVAQYIVPKIAAALARQAPGARLEYQASHNELVPTLSELPLDRVSTLTEDLPAALCSQPQGEDGLAVLMGPQHPLAGQPLTLAAYLAAQHIRVSGGGDKESAVDQLLAQQGEQRHWFAHVPFFQAAVGILRGTDTLLTTPAHIAWQLAEDYQLLLRPLPFTSPRQHYHLIWPQRLHHDPAHRWFRELAWPFLAGHLQQTAQQAASLLQQHTHLE